MGNGKRGLPFPKDKQVKEHTDVFYYQSVGSMSVCKKAVVLEHYENFILIGVCRKWGKKPLYTTTVQPSNLRLRSAM